MGYKIGVPSLKLNNVGNKSKHCGSFGGVAYEGLEERKGLDNDIDPTMSQYNVYTGYRSAAELMEYSAQHLQDMKDACGRGIRKDAVVMCATIFKPPAAYMNTLTMEEQRRLLGDCLEFLKPVVGADNIKSTAQHFDERGAHMHVFWEPMTSDGRLCAKELHNIKFFGYVNENLPAYLRERGWEIDDADCYDRAQREREDVEAAEERYQKRKQQGRSSAAFKLEAEKQKQELLRENDDLIAGNSRLIGTNGLLKVENANLQDENKDLQEQNEQLLHGIQQLSALKTMAEYQAQVIENDKAIANFRNTVHAVTEESQRRGLTWGAAKAFVTLILDGMKDVIEQLRIKINRVKLFETLHNLFDRAGDRQERTLNDILANAYSRSGSASEGAHGHELEQNQTKA